MWTKGTEVGEKYSSFTMRDACNEPMSETRLYIVQNLVFFECILVARLSGYEG